LNCGCRPETEDDAKQQGPEDLHRFSP
jgi:hypothetical protein